MQLWPTMHLGIQWNHNYSGEWSQGWSEVHIVRGVVFLCHKREPHIKLFPIMGQAHYQLLL